MFYLFVVFYFITPVTPLTIEADFEFEPDWNHGFNLKTPKDTKPLSDNNAFKQNGDITSEADLISHSNDESEGNEDVSKEFSTTSITTTSLKIYKKKEKTTKRESLRKPHKQLRIKQHAIQSYSNTDIHPIRNGYKENDDVSGTDDNDYKDGYGVQEDEDIEVNSDSYDHDKKTFSSFNRNGNKGYTTNDNVSSSFTRLLKDSTEIQSKDALKSEEKVSLKQHVRHNKNEFDFNNVKLPVFNKSLSISNVLGNIFGVLNNTFAYAFANKPKNILGNDWKQKPKIKTKNVLTTSQQILQNVRSKTQNAVELRNDQSQDRIGSEWNIKMKNINDNDFYSTPAVLFPIQFWNRALRMSKHSDEISEMSSNLQKVKNETKAGFLKLYQELNQESQRIKDNATISSFTKHILNRTLKLFDVMKEKSLEYRWKKKMKHLATSYEKKFKEFLKATRNHTIRTRLGTRKFILSAIDVSSRIVNRLINFMANDMEKKGFTYNNLTSGILRTEVSKEKEHELQQACKKLGICSSKKGFTQFITDMLLKMLTVENVKFKSAFDSMLEFASKTDFDFSARIADGIKKKLEYCKRQNIKVQKGIIMIIKNMVTSKDIPLILYNDSNSNNNNLQSTLAFLEIINTLDEQVPNDNYNIRQWDSMRQEMDEWVHGRNRNIQPTMFNFISHIKNVLKYIDGGSWNIVSRNAKILFL